MRLGFALSVGSGAETDDEEKVSLPQDYIGRGAAASLLEITLPSTKPAVRAAYRKKASSCHPDVAPDAAAPMASSIASVASP